MVVWSSNLGSRGARGSSDFAVVANVRPVIATLEALPKHLPKTMKRAMLASLLGVQGRAQRKVGGEVLNIRTRALQRSIFTELMDNGKAEEMEGRVGTPIIYGKVHEFGATIRPKKAKALFIPLNRGAAQLHAHLYQGVGSGKGLPFDLEFGTDFVFAKQVRIPPRPWLGPSLDEERPKIDERFRNAMDDAIAASILDANKKATP